MDFNETNEYNKLKKFENAKIVKKCHKCRKKRKKKAGTVTSKLLCANKINGEAHFATTVDFVKPKMLLKRKKEKLGKSKHRDILQRGNTFNENKVEADAITDSELLNVNRKMSELRITTTADIDIPNNLPNSVEEVKLITPKKFKIQTKTSAVDKPKENLESTVTSKLTITMERKNETAAVVDSDTPTKFAIRKFKYYLRTYKNAKIAKKISTVKENSEKVDNIDTSKITCLKDTKSGADIVPVVNAGVPRKFFQRKVDSKGNNKKSLKQKKSNKRNIRGGKTTASKIKTNAKTAGGSKEQSRYNNLPEDDVSIQNHLKKVTKNEKNSLVVTNNMNAIIQKVPIDFDNYEENLKEFFSSKKRKPNVNRGFEQENAIKSLGSVYKQPIDISKLKIREFPIFNDVNLRRSKIRPLTFKIDLKEDPAVTARKLFQKALDEALQESLKAAKRTRNKNNVESMNPPIEFVGLEKDSNDFENNLTLSDETFNTLDDDSLMFPVTPGFDLNSEKEEHLPEVNNESILSLEANFETLKIENEYELRNREFSVINGVEHSLSFFKEIFSMSILQSLHLKKVESEFKSSLEAKIETDGNHCDKGVTHLEESQVLNNNKSDIDIMPNKLDTESIKNVDINPILLGFDSVGMPVTSMETQNQPLKNDDETYSLNNFSECQVKGQKETSNIDVVENNTLSSNLVAMPPILKVLSLKTPRNHAKQANCSSQHLKYTVADITQTSLYIDSDAIPSTSAAARKRLLQMEMTKNKKYSKVKLNESKSSDLNKITTTIHSNFELVYPKSTQSSDIPKCPGHGNRMCQNSAISFDLSDNESNPFKKCEDKEFKMISKYLFQKHKIYIKENSINFKQKMSEGRDASQTVMEPFLSSLPNILQNEINVLRKYRKWLHNSLVNIL